MSKSILILDTPRDCNSCSLRSYTSGKGDICVGKYKNGIYVSIDRLSPHYIPSWCPLKRMPRRDHYLYEKNDESAFYQKGWNACLDEIEFGDW